MSRTICSRPAFDPKTAPRAGSRILAESPSLRSLAATGKLCKTLLGALTVLSLLATTAPLTAQGPTVGLARVGPVDPSDNFPRFYQDTQGLRLQICRSPANCLFALPDPKLPLTFPTNYPDEQFYWSAEATAVGAPGARILYVSALEAAFANGAPAEGEQMVFTRYRLRITGLLNGAAYTVTHPYGSARYIAGLDGPLPGTINVTDDIGVAPGQFQLALHGNVGPFLTPVGFQSRFPGVFISDGASEVPVQGSPYGTNFLRIEGPGIGNTFPANAVNANRIQINTFVLVGQIATVGGVGITNAYVGKQASPSRTAVTVWAIADPGARLQVTAPGAGFVAMTEVGSSGKFFGRLAMPGNSACPNSVTVTNLSDQPQTSTTQNGLVDQVAIASAIYMIDHGIYVTASSSDKVGNPRLTMSGTGLSPTQMESLGDGVASGVLLIGPGIAPPEMITVTSASGGSATVAISAEEPAPVAADAGPDQHVAAGAQVSLTAANSSGPIFEYSWAQTSGPAVALTGARTANASFSAPNQLTASTLTFALTVSGSFGQTSADLVTIQVDAVPPVVADAGASQFVDAGVLVSLSAAGSSGPIVSYAWSTSLGNSLALTGADTASMSFLAPSLPQASLITVTLTVAGEFGQSSTASAIIAVSAFVPPPLRADAGADQSVASRALVTLTGAGSSGPIAGYLWTHDAGINIQLDFADTATPSFTAPALPTASVITFTLTVSDGNGSTASDTVVVNVAAMPPPPTDVVTISRAQYLQADNAWRLQGSNLQRQGQTVTIYVGAIGDYKHPIGICTVAADGRWQLNTVKRSGPQPALLDTTVWAESSLGGTPAQSTFARR